MTARVRSKQGFGKGAIIFSLALVAVAVTALFLGGAIRSLIRESLMQRATSAHYEVLYPAGSLPQDAAGDFATQRESLFTALDRKLVDADSNAEIRIILDPGLPGPPSAGAGMPYSVDGTTIRIKLNGQDLHVPAAADAEALLYAAWGKPGNGNIARWTALWLVGDWHGAEIGMAAAQLEQTRGHAKVETLLAPRASNAPSADDETLLGAAWISQIAELGGASTVRKLYSAKMAQPTVAEVTKVLGTTPLELDRKWQMWMYAYLAGMPATSHDGGMPMDMPMGGSH